MKILTEIPLHDLNACGRVAREIERSGFTGTSSQENRHDPFLPLAVAATNTTELELRTNVAIAFARSPMSSANLAWDLQKASRGRFILGLGSQVRGHNVRRFSVPWSPPAPRMREYVQSIRAIFDCWHNGNPLSYEGEHYQFSLMTPNFTPEPLDSAPPPIHIAAVGPAMMKVAAEECDGVMLHPFCTRTYFDDVVLPRLTKGLANANRDRADFEISGGGFVATGASDADVAKVFEWVRMRVGFYGSTPSYWPVLEAHDQGDLGRKLNAMSKKGQWEQMTTEVPDDLVHHFAAVGTFETIAEVLKKRFVGATDVLSMPKNTPPDLLQDLKAIS